MNKTILYYTSNREDPRFEGKIIQTLLENSGDIPIISISQVPMNVGDNICVGDVGLSYVNEFRQILLGAKKATTEYVQYAESDFIYSKDYFNFEPSGEDAYLYDNVWIVYKEPRFDKYYRKIYSEGAQICRREYLIEKFERFLADKPQWFDGRLKLKGEEPFQHWDKSKKPTARFSGAPCISFKTGKGVSKYTRTLDETGMALAYWGNIIELKKTYGLS
jgi:hypothetical protein